MAWRGRTASSGDRHRYSGYSNANYGGGDRRHGYSDQQHSRSSGRHQTSATDAPSSSRFKRQIPTSYEPGIRHQSHGRFVSPGNQLHQSSTHQSFHHYNQQGYSEPHAFSTYPSSSTHAYQQPQLEQDQQRMLTAGGQRSNTACTVTSPQYGASVLSFHSPAQQQLVPQQQPVTTTQPPPVSVTAKPLPPDPAELAKQMPFDPSKFDSRLENPDFCLQLINRNSFNFYLRNEPPPLAATSANVISRPPAKECIDELVDVAKKKGIFDDLRAACGKKLKESPFFEKVVNRVHEEAHAYLTRIKFQPTLNKHVEFDRLKRHIAKRTQASQQVAQVLEGMPRHHLLSGKTIASVLPSTNDEEDANKDSTTPAAIHARLCQLISTTLREKYPATSKPVTRSSKRCRLSLTEEDAAANYTASFYQDADAGEDSGMKRSKAENEEGYQGKRTSPSMGATSDLVDVKPASASSNQSVVMSEEHTEARSASSGNNSMDIVDDDDDTEGGTTPKLSGATDGAGFTLLGQVEAASPPKNDDLFIDCAPISAVVSTATLTADVSASTSPGDVGCAISRHSLHSPDPPSVSPETNNMATDENSVDASNPSSASSKTVVSMPLQGELASPTPSPLGHRHTHITECDVLSESPAMPTGSGAGISTIETADFHAADVEVEKELHAGKTEDDGPSTTETENTDGEYGTPKTAVTDTDIKSPMVELSPIIVAKRPGRNRAKPPTAAAMPAKVFTAVELDDEQHAEQHQSPVVDTASDDAGLGRQGTRRTRRINVRYTSNEFVTNIPGLRKKKPAKNTAKSKRGK